MADQASMTENQESTAKEVEEARTAVTASLSSIGNSVTADLQARANDLHENAAAIEKQEKELAKQTAALAKQNDQFQTLLDKSTKSLNEVGDVQNWAEMIERDLLVVEETLRLAEGREERENASGTNGWT